VLQTPISQNLHRCLLCSYHFRWPSIPLSNFQHDHQHKLDHEGNPHLKLHIYRGKQPWCFGTVFNLHRWHRLRARRVGDSFRHVRHMHIKIYEQMLQDLLFSFRVFRWPLNANRCDWFYHTYCFQRQQADIILQWRDRASICEQLISASERILHECWSGPIFHLGQIHVHRSVPLPLGRHDLMANEVAIGICIDQRARGDKQFHRKLLKFLWLLLGDPARQDCDERDSIDNSVYGREVRLLWLL